MVNGRLSIDNKTTTAARRRYNRIAATYDHMESFVERAYFSKWRKLQWSKVEGTQILEVGVGTGKNIPFYPAGAEITAIDFSEEMLKRAKERAERREVKVRLRQMDVQNMDFKDNSFDSVVATFVFCSVPDPIQGLQEINRVCKPGGKIILLDHVLHANVIIGNIMNLANPFVVPLMGANINRQTVSNVIKSDLTLESVTDLGFGIFKLIEARAKKSTSPA
jgi:ubiquinone/menaquinone biosynthesis C-methylase UbiE